MSRKYTIEEAREIFAKDGCTLLEKEYIQSGVSMAYICKCGNVSKMSLVAKKSGQLCYECGIKKIKAKKIYTYEYVFDYFKNKGCTLLSTKYVGTNELLDYICSCGDTYHISFNNFKRGRRCKSCGNKKRSKAQNFSYAHVYNYFEDQGCKLLSSTYSNVDSALKYICNCGRQSKITFYSFRKGARCKACGIEKMKKKQKLSYTYVHNYFEEQGCKLLSDTYVNNHTGLDYICNCGRQDKIRFANFQSGNRCWPCTVEKRSGDTSASWNPNLTDEERKQNRAYPEYTQWRNDVYTRDKHTCIKCDTKGGNLNAHHIASYRAYPELRIDTDNGVTLCEDCHSVFHGEYGYTNFTPEDYLEFITYNDQIATELAVV